MGLDWSVIVYMAIKTIPFSRLETDLKETLNECAESGETIVVEMPDPRLLAIQSLDPNAMDAVSRPACEKRQPQQPEAAQVQTAHKTQKARLIVEGVEISSVASNSSDAASRGQFQSPGGDSR